MSVGVQLYMHWKKRWEENQEGRYRGNINRESYMLHLVSKELGSGQTKELIDYYLETADDPDFDHFAYNYDKLIESKEERERDQARRAKIRDRTRQIMKSRGELD